MQCSESTFPRGGLRFCAKLMELQLKAGEGGTEPGWMVGGWETCLHSGHGGGEGGGLCLYSSRAGPGSYQGNLPCLLCIPKDAQFGSTGKVGKGAG